MKIYDISRPLKAGTPGWPGDTPYTYEVNWSKEETGSVNVGKVTMSIHTGTHVDAPFHFDSDGQRIAEIDPEIYIGAARVIDVSGTDVLGTEQLRDVDLTGVERVLLRTNSWVDPDVFPQSITCLSPELGPFLKKAGVRLVGVDVPSVDPLDSKELGAHHSLTKNGVHILEGLDLTEIEEGEYELVALPLSMEEADGSPVRAVLRK